MPITTDLNPSRPPARDVQDEPAPARRIAS
jgi:hypothetical protein